MASILNDQFKGIFADSNSANIDNHVFRSYYLFTSGLLFAAAGIVISSQFFGAPIDCIPDIGHREDPIKSTIDMFCWVSATYTVNELYGSDRTIYDGVGQFDPSKNHTQRFQLYYRWIALLLIVQALLFYMPHYFWSNWEGGKMSGLSSLLNVPVEPTLDGDRRRTRIELLLDHLEAFDINSNNYYTYRFYTCEVLNLITLGVNAWMTNWITDGWFLKIGPDVLRRGYSSGVLTRMFPLQAKCLWRSTGPSGSIQEFDALCLLPLNSFNKVFFALLWFWFLMLGIITILWLLFRATTFLLPIKSRLLRWKACPVDDESHHHSEDTDCVDFICKYLPHPDYFVLLQLVDNVDSVVIKNILGGLCERISHMQRRRSTNPQIITTAEEKPLLLT